MTTLSSSLKDLIVTSAIAHKIDPVYLLAVAKTESEFNLNAQRFEPAYPWLYSIKELSEILKVDRSTMESFQRSSYGIFQVMGAVAYEYGFRDWPAKLFDAETNCRYACEHIVRLRERHEVYYPEESYATFNGGSPRRNGNIWVNQRNVTRFMKNYEQVKSWDLNF